MRTATMHAYPMADRPGRVTLGRSAVGTRIQLAAGVGVAVTYLLALGIGQDQAAMGIIGIGALMSVIWPAAGLAMFVVIMPMREPDLLVPVRFNAIMAGAITFGCILRLPVDRPVMRVHPGVVLLLGYLVYSALSIPPELTGHPAAWVPSALNVLLRLSTGVALFLSATYLFRLMSPWPILGLALVGATLAAVLAVGQIAGVLPFGGLVGGLLEQTGGLRAAGAFADPNFLGLYMATAAVFALGLLGIVSRSMRFALIPVVVLLFASVAVAYSRGATLGTLAGVITLVGLRHRLVGLLLLVAAAAFVVVLYPLFLEARQGGILTPSESFDMTISEAGRVTLARAGISMFAANPIFGVGFGVFQYASPAYVTGGAPDSTFSHDQYLNILAEQGVVGAVMLAGVVVFAAIALARSRSPLRNTAVAMGVAYLVVSLFLHSLTIFQSSSLIWLVLAATLATQTVTTESRWPP